MAERESGAAEVVIYTKMWCPYCHRAKDMLEKKGVKFHEIDVTFSPDKRAEMSARAEGRTTVPQIFIEGQGIGGSDELAELDAAGKLDRLLGRAA
ncbi:MAG TPA: glutaredoxin 3 [Alphaproteobacteria bacterium]|nr:glutaredoxin 3 [Alphaproteobacteria bacterium]